MEEGPMRISNAELDVMEVLWSEAPLGAAEVTAALGDKDWSGKTVKTLLARLDAEGALAAEPEGRRYLYTPLVEAADYRRDAVGSMARRLFGGKAAPMVAHLADAKGLTDEDLAELEDLVRSLRDDR
jgi:BlaI family penicillinase repressor